MKISTITGIVTVLMLFITLSLAFIIYTNSQKMNDIDMAMMSNVDSIQYLADLRGFSSRISIIIHEKHIYLAGNHSLDPGLFFNKLTATQSEYKGALKNFKMLVAEIEKGESGRPVEEMGEELPTLNAALSSAAQLSEPVEKYLQTRLEADQPGNELFEAVFEYSSTAINLEKKHYDELTKQMERLDIINMNVVAPFSFVVVLLLLVAFLFIQLQVVAPLRKISKSVEEISLGRLDTVIDPRFKEAKNEIGDLARAFERTVVSMKLAMKKAGKTKPSEEQEKKPSEIVKSAFKIRT